MTITERLVIKELVESLNKSTETSWTSGYLNDWIDWAKKMKAVIQTSTPILEKLSSEENPIQE